MEKNKRYTLILFVALAALFATAVAALPSRSQNRSTPIIQEQDFGKQAEKSHEQVADSRSKSAVPSDDLAASSVFNSAAMQNNLLRTSLSWAFGGKQQRGWYLYTPLINSMIATDKDAGTSDFALALSRWQKSAGLTPHGILDNNTLSLMVSTWQARRTKDRTYPQPHQLFTAPASDFYDPSRPGELRQVEQQTYLAYKRMVAAAAADPSLQLAVTPNGELAPTEKYLKIISGFRSKEYQEHLRKQLPNAGRAALAVNSPHFTGRALDIYVGGEPVIAKDHNRAIQVQTPVYKWLVKNAEKFGFRPYYYEPWHWEYCGEPNVDNAKILVP